jgi:hypothetical protein
MVREIVCAFRRDELPAAQLAIYHRFERSTARAGFRIRVRLLPLEDLPEHVDVLVIAPELRAEAAAVVKDARLVVTTRPDAGAAATALLGEIAAGETLTAERVQPGDPKLVTHRGSEIL